MKRHALWALLGPLLAAAAAAQPEPLEPRAGYLAAAGAPSGSQSLFAPWRVWAAEPGDVLQNVTAGSQEDCAALCWQQPNCTLFDFRSCAAEVSRQPACPCSASLGAPLAPSLPTTRKRVIGMPRLPRPPAQNASASCAGVPPNTCRLLSMECGTVAPPALAVKPSDGDVRWAAAGERRTGRRGATRHPRRLPSASVLLPPVLWPAAQPAGTP